MELLFEGKARLPSLGKYVFLRRVVERSRHRLGSALLFMTPQGTQAPDSRAATETLQLSSRVARVIRCEPSISEKHEHTLLLKNQQEPCKNTHYQEETSLRPNLTAVQLGHGSSPDRSICKRS